MIRSLLQSLPLALALFSASLTAHAHRFHAGITDLSFNARTGSIEVVHTFMAHDVEALLVNLYQRQFDLSQPEDEALLRKYVEKQFSLLAADKTRLPLRWVGIQIDVERIVIYQEAENTALERAAAMRNDVLTDFLPDQTNTVNIKRASGIVTLSFDRKAPEQRLP